MLLRQPAFCRQVHSSGLVLLWHNPNTPKESIQELCRPKPWQHNENFSKASPLCGSVTLGFAPDAPLLVQYDLETEDNGHMKFYLAPKIDE